jgi:hypothetical protein
MSQAPILPWSDIHRLELLEEYPAAIDAIEGRLAADPNETEAIIRLGFNLWYAVVEDSRMQKGLPVQQFAARFMELFDTHFLRLLNDADFCWSYGLGMSLFWFYFPGATEELGNVLLDRARTIEPFWASLHKPGTDLSRLKDRGIFAAYYHVT